MVLCQWSDIIRSYAVKSRPLEERATTSGHNVECVDVPIAAAAAAAGYWETAERGMRRCRELNTTKCLLGRQFIHHDNFARGRNIDDTGWNGMKRE